MIEPAPPLPDRRRSLPFGRALLALWGAGAVVLSAYLLGTHLVALPAPSAIDPRLAASMARLAEESRVQPGELSIVHALYESCKCSQNVMQHLLARHPAAHETVLIVDAEASTLAILRAAGYEARRVAEGELESRYGIRGVPVLVISNARGEVQYVGGYGDRKQSPVVRDVELVAQVSRGEHPAPLPVFGCAVSDSLRSSLDPLGVGR